jgi:drug/metabolite transporter (DMT)-like permease
MGYGIAITREERKMIYYFLLLLSIILAVCKSSLYNSYAKKEPTLGATFCFNAISYGAAAVVAWIGMMFSSKAISATTVLCAFFYATIVVSLQTISITAMRVGTMATTSICIMYGMIIPSVAGPIFWKEPIGLLQIAGIIMMIVSLWLIKEKASAVQRKTTKKWSVLAIFAFVLSGMAGVMEKIHQSTKAAAEKLPFVFVACVFMLVFSVTARWITRKNTEKTDAGAMISLAALSGLVIGLYSTVNLTLSGKLDSMIYYPIANGGAMLLTVLVSVIVFKERFDKPRIIGTGIGLLGILCLSIPV